MENELTFDHMKSTAEIHNHSSGPHAFQLLHHPSLSLQHFHLPLSLSYFPFGMKLQNIIFHINCIYFLFYNMNNSCGFLRSSTAETTIAIIIIIINK